MSLESLYQCCMLLAAVVSAFSISTIVGMLITRPWGPSRMLGSTPGQPGPR